MAVVVAHVVAVVGRAESVDQADPVLESTAVVGLVTPPLAAGSCSTGCQAEA